jgi:hypothetical protein
MDTLIKVIAAVAIIGIFSCAKTHCDPKTKLVFLQETPVMAKPYPHWYKSPPNEVLTTMRAGQSVPICRFTPAKDFAIYEVKLPNGRMGYVEFDAATAKEITSE